MKNILFKFIYICVKILYCFMVLIYTLIPISIVFFDIVDFDGKYREVITFAIIPVLIGLYIFTVELPSIIFKVPVERYAMFSNKYKRSLLSIVLTLVLILFLVETIVFLFSTKVIDYYNVILFLIMTFFRITLRMSSIELTTIRSRFFG